MLGPTGCPRGRLQGHVATALRRPCVRPGGGVPEHRRAEGASVTMGTRDDCSHGKATREDPVVLHRKAQVRVLSMLASGEDVVECRPQRGMDPVHRRRPRSGRRAGSGPARGSSSRADDAPCAARSRAGTGRSRSSARATPPGRTRRSVVAGRAPALPGPSPSERSAARPGHRRRSRNRRGGPAAACQKGRGRRARRTTTRAAWRSFSAGQGCRAPVSTSTA
jgi:hypothetical protein